MWNIIKAQNYQTRNDIVVIAALIFIGALSIISPYFNGLNIPFSEITGSIYAVNSEKTFLLFILLIVTTRVCGWDQSDKTINYEILAGHNRLAVYFGRIITSIIWVTVSCAVLLFGPLAVCTVINGWGYNADFNGVMLRYLLAFLPIIRVTCELALLTFILRRGGLSGIVGYLLIDGVVITDSILSMESNIEITWQFGVTNLMCLTGFPDFSYGYVNGEDIKVFETALDPSLIIGTAAASIIVGAACLIIGSVIFRKSNMK